MKYRPKLDPKVDLKGATPETLARALLRNRLRLKREREIAATVPQGGNAGASPASSKKRKEF